MPVESATPDADAPESTGSSLESVSAVVDEHGAAMYRVAIAIVRDPAFAEDVVQESTIKAWDHRATYRGEGPLRNWLLRITHNTAVSMLRADREESWDPQSLPDMLTPGPERRVIARNELEAAMDALGRLDPLSRSILAMREGEAMSYQDIADALGITLGQVKIRLLRARRKIEQAVERGTS
jgi:RNA polymerase sigma-70 factor (ECF subfamily)